MPEYLAPAVYVEETSFRSKSIEGVGTSTAAFVGMTARGPVTAGTNPAKPVLLTSFTDFERLYGGLDDLRIGGSAARNHIAHAAFAFFNNGGGRLYVARLEGASATNSNTGVLNDPATVAAGKQVRFESRFAGGSEIPGEPGTNLNVQLIQEELATTKELALRQSAGTMVQVGTDYYIIGTNPMVTSAANAAAFNALADADSLTIISLGVVVSDSTGVVMSLVALHITRSILAMPGQFWGLIHRRRMTHSITRWSSISVTRPSHMRFALPFLERQQIAQCR